jgi:LmbE family N-acetylglucosaminyl deacetylase
MLGRLKLLCALAHPDDETLGLGGAIARYASEGVEVHLVTATRGQKGWFGEEKDYPGAEELGRIREAELRAAADVLGITSLSILDYLDGELDGADPLEATAQVVYHLRRVQPQVVVTFAHDGVYGHPDHIAMCQFTTAAVAASASAAYRPDLGEAHLVSKLYYRATLKEQIQAYEAAFGELVMNIDGVERRSQTWAPWSITTVFDTSQHWERVWEAVTRHRSQLPGYQKLKDLPPELHKALWGRQEYYRVFSLVNGGRALESDLFEGLR